MDRSSEVIISQSNGKITRRHSRQKSGRNAEVKGERFSLQGKRWRFPRDLVSAEVETRITRLRALWDDHERFCHGQVFVDPAELSGVPEFVLEEQAKRFIKRQASATTTCQENDHAASPDTWAPFGRDGRSGVVTTGDEAAQWSPLALWIADQIKRGVQPVPLPPLPELLKSVFHNSLVDYRFGNLAQVFSGPSDSHPQTIAELRWQDAFQLLNRLTTDATLQFGVYWRRLVLPTLEHGHHQTAVLAFPDGLPDLLISLPIDPDNEVADYIGLCTSNDLPAIRLQIKKTAQANDCTGFGGRVFRQIKHHTARPRAF